MASDLYNSDLENRRLSSFFDVFILTDDGLIRRTALPKAKLDYAMWLLRPESEISSESLDRMVRAEADRSLCGYGEALFNVIDRLMDDDMCLKFLDMYTNMREYAYYTVAFSQEQMRREHMWREANSEWGEDLPPALN